VEGRVKCGPSSVVNAAGTVDVVLANGTSTLMFLTSTRIVDISSSKFQIGVDV
jgi:hypothetical protein